LKKEYQGYVFGPTSIQLNLFDHHIEPFLINSGYHTCQRDQFSEERSNNQLKFGTSVFHAYVHEWSCQLKYNPRINEGWGMSDGEGMERIWAYLSPLISSLRYSTKNHRLSALHFRSTHHNQVGKMHACKDSAEFSISVSQADSFIHSQ
jgi:hypothetical protein